MWLLGKTTTSWSRTKLWSQLLGACDLVEILTQTVCCNCTWALPVPALYMACYHSWVGPGITAFLHTSPDVWVTTYYAFMRKVISQTTLTSHNNTQTFVIWPINPPINYCYSSYWQFRQFWASTEIIHSTFSWMLKAMAINNIIKTVTIDGGKIQHWSLQNTNK